MWCRLDVVQLEMKDPTGVKSRKVNQQTRRKGARRLSVGGRGFKAEGYPEHLIAEPPQCQLEPDEFPSRSALCPSAFGSVCKADSKSDQGLSPWESSRPMVVRPNGVSFWPLFVQPHFLRRDTSDGHFGSAPCPAWLPTTKGKMGGVQTLLLKTIPGFQVQEKKHNSNKTTFPFTRCFPDQSQRPKKLWASLL